MPDFNGNTYYFNKCVFYRPSTASGNITLDLLKSMDYIVWSKGPSDSQRSTLIAATPVGRWTAAPENESFYWLPEPEGPSTLTTASATASPSNYNALSTNPMDLRPDQFLLEVHNNAAKNTFNSIGVHDEGWFLHIRNADGTRGERVRDGTFYHMNPANKNWQRYYWSCVKERLDQSPSRTAGGIVSFFTDNVHLGLPKIEGFVNNLNGSRGEEGPYEYYFAETDTTTRAQKDAAYASAWAEFMNYGRTYLDSIGYTNVQVVGNMIEYGRSISSTLYDQFTGMAGFLDESWGNAFGTLRSGSSMEAQLAWTKTALMAGKHVLCVARENTASRSAARERYVWGLFKLIESRTAYFRYCPGSGGDYANWYEIAEMSLDTGDPLASFYKDTYGNLVREFSKLTIEVNHSSTSTRNGIAPLGVRTTTTNATGQTWTGAWQYSSDSEPPPPTGIGTPPTFKGLYHTATTIGADTATTISVPKNGALTLAAGDLIFGYIALVNAGGQKTVTPNQSGWTAIPPVHRFTTSGIGVHMFHRTVQTGEAGTLGTFTFGVSGGDNLGADYKTQFAVFSGAHLTTPVQTSQSNTSTAATSHTAPSLYASGGPTTQLSIWAINAYGNYQPTIPAVEVGNDVSLSGVSVSATLAYEAQPTASPTTLLTGHTATSSASGSGLGITVLLAPLPPTVVTDAEVIFDVPATVAEGGSLVLSMFKPNGLAAGGATISANWTATFGTASAADLSQTSGVLSFTGDDSGTSAAILVTEDTIPELTETVTITFSSLVNCVAVSPTQFVVNVYDNEATTASVVVSVTPATLAEALAGSAVFTVALTNALGTTESLDYVLEGSAERGVDYSTAALAGGTLIFSPGQISIPITVTAINDVAPESIETITLRLLRSTYSANLNVPLNDPTATVSITDDDATVSGDPPAVITGMLVRDFITGLLQDQAHSFVIEFDQPTDPNVLSVDVRIQRDGYNPDDPGDALWVFNVPLSGFYTGTRSTGQAYCSLEVTQNDPTQPGYIFFGRSYVVGLDTLSATVVGGRAQVVYAMPPVPADRMRAPTTTIKNADVDERPTLVISHYPLEQWLLPNYDYVTSAIYPDAYTIARTINGTPNPALPTVVDYVPSAIRKQEWRDIGLVAIEGVAQDAAYTVLPQFNPLESGIVPSPVLYGAGNTPTFLVRPKKIRVRLYPAEARTVALVLDAIRHKLRDPFGIVVSDVEIIHHMNMAFGYGNAYYGEIVRYGFSWPTVDLQPSPLVIPLPEELVGLPPIAAFWKAVSTPMDLIRITNFSHTRDTVVLPHITIWRPDAVVYLDFMTPHPRIDPVLPDQVLVSMPTRFVVEQTTALILPLCMQRTGEDRSMELKLASDAALLETQSSGGGPSFDMWGNGYG